MDEKVTERLVHAIFNSIDEVNQQLPKERKLEKSVKVNFFKELEKLDSLNFIIFISAIEKNVSQEFSVNFVLADEKILEQKDNVFETIQSLANYIYSNIKRR